MDGFSSIDDSDEISPELSLASSCAGLGDGGTTELWELDVEVHADGLRATTSICLGVPGVEQPLDEFFAECECD